MLKFAAERCTAASLLADARRLPLSIDISHPHGTALSSKPAASALFSCWFRAVD